MHSSFSLFKIANITFSVFQRNAQPLPTAMISGAWGHVTNKHYAEIRLRNFCIWGKRQIIGVYKRSAACDIVQLEHLDNQIVAKVPSYLRFLFLLRLRYRTLAHKQLLPDSMLIMQLDHCPLAFPRFGLFSGVSLDALALETAVHTMIDVAAVSSLHMSCRLLTRAPYQP